ncbi:hypothetical protein ACVWWJ_001789 [Luteibacter sp. HA06]
MGLNVPKRQHILPAASIKRFYDEAKKSVDLYSFKAGKRFRRAATKDEFIVTRAWDSNLEIGMRPVEAEFQGLADTLAGECVLTEAQNETASRFHALLRARSMAHDKVDQTSLFDQASVNYSQESEEHREQAEMGGIFLFAGPNDMDRLVRGMVVRQAFGSVPPIKWKTTVAVHREFVVTDNYRHLVVIPISPVLCLVPVGETAMPSRRRTREFNERLAAQSERWYLARDLSATGIAEHGG